MEYSKEQPSQFGIRKTIKYFVAKNKVKEFNITDSRLMQNEGAFVTLHSNGVLRGCIGQIIPTKKPLWKVVRDMAIAACSEDNRFLPVAKNELDNLDYEISVLSTPIKIDNWQDIKLGEHGVIIQKGRQVGVFLPQVATETGWTLEEFLSQLCSQKAGLSSNCYKDPMVDIKTFTVQVFRSSNT